MQGFGGIPHKASNTLDGLHGHAPTQLSLCITQWQADTRFSTEQDCSLWTGLRALELSTLEVASRLRFYRWSPSTTWHQVTACLQFSAEGCCCMEGETEQVDGPISARHVHSGIAGRSVQDRGIAEERDRDDLIFHSSPSGPFLSNIETIKLVLSILLLNCRTDCSTAR
jgi:hypothetical protein